MKARISTFYRGITALYLILISMTMAEQPAENPINNKPKELQIFESEELLPELKEKTVMMNIGDAIQFLATAPIVLQAGHENAVDNPLLATNGSIVATAFPGDQNTVKLWNATTGRQLPLSIQFPDLIESLAMNKDFIVAGSGDGTLKISHTDGTLLRILKYPDGIDSIAFDSDSNRLAFSVGGQVKVITIDNNRVRLLTTISIPDTQWVKVAIHGNIVATALPTEGFVKIWNIAARKPVLIFDQESDYNIHSIVANGNFVAYAENEAGIIQVYVINSKESFSLICSEEAKDLAMSGDVIATGDYKTEIWDLNTRRLVATINTGMDKVALSGSVLVTSVTDFDPEILSLTNPFAGTPDTNPLLWIIHFATIPQADLIKRAYQATIANQEFMIDWPSEDAKVFLSFPAHVRQYLTARLKIRRR
jgi:WD40 repeat protein